MNPSITNSTKPQDAPQPISLGDPLPNCSFQVHELPVAGARLRVSSFGGQTLEWLITDPRDNVVRPVHFVSSIADLTGTQYSIRGGGQLAGWPNFGSGDLGFPKDSFSSSKLPAHGLLRTKTFAVLDGHEPSNGENFNSITLIADSNEQDLQKWPFKFKCRHTIIHLSDPTSSTYTLINTVTFSNEDIYPFPAQGFFHNYFAISDASKVEILGPQGRKYHDIPDAHKEKTDNSTASSLIDGKTLIGRIYQGLHSVQLKDPIFKRTITVSGGTIREPAEEGQSDTVIWNPGKWELPSDSSIAPKYPFLKPEDSRQMVCIESGRINSQMLNPLEEIVISQHITVSFDS